MEPAPGTKQQECRKSHIVTYLSSSPLFSPPIPLIRGLYFILKKMIPYTITKNNPRSTVRSDYPDSQGASSNLHRNSGNAGILFRKSRILVNSIPWEAFSRIVQPFWKKYSASTARSSIQSSTVGY